MQATIEETISEPAEDNSQPKFTQKIAEICSLFDQSALQQEIIDTEKKVIADISAILQKCSSDNFFVNFEEKAIEDMANLFTDGEINPVNYTIEQHISSIGKIMQDNNLILQKTIREHQVWKADKLKKIGRLNVDIDIKKELQMLNNLCQYSEKYDAWKFPVFDLSYNDIELDFDDIYFDFDFSKDSVKAGVTTFAGDNARYDSEGSNYYHPHISSSGAICMGEVEHAAQLFWERKELYNLMTFLIETLGTYNSRSPFAELISFTEEEMEHCESCGESVYGDDIVYIDDKYGTQYPSCDNCRIRTSSGDFDWKEKYYWSAYQNEWILKVNATKAYIDHNNQTWIKNILSNDMFAMCPHCNNFIHIDYLNNGLCRKCEAKMEEATA